MTSRYGVEYFPEGVGFVFVKMLGHGAHSTACFVRSLGDNNLYVRKEDHDASNKNSDTSPEVTVARMIRSVPGVVGFRGWLSYREQKEAKTFFVTYWTYCNAGTVFQCLTTYSKHRCDFPERWACRWLISMLETVRGIHGKGVAHDDGHNGNWFLHRQSFDTDPKVVLGDFDNSLTVQMLGHEGKYIVNSLVWNKAATFDVIGVCHTIRGI